VSADALLLSVAFNQRLAVVPVQSTTKFSARVSPHNKVAHLRFLMLQTRGAIVVIKSVRNMQRCSRQRSIF
jgi:hypothetical protein